MSINNPQYVEVFRSYYNEALKPMLEEGHYELVHQELSNDVILLMTLGESGDVVTNTHFGLILVAYIIKLHEETENGSKPESSTIRDLEVALAQTQLPI